MSKKMTKAACGGCEQDFYNGNNDLGVKECWSFATAKIILRRRVGVNDVPPWTAKPTSKPSCYRQRGAIYVGSKVTQ